MMPPKAEIREAIERAIGLLESLAGDDMNAIRGQIITHEQLAEAFRVEYRTPAYYNLASRLKWEVLNRYGISMEASPLVGYELNTDRGQIGNVLSKIVQAGRRNRDARKIAVALPMEQCHDMATMRTKSFLEEVTAEGERKARELRQRAAFLMRPTPTREPAQLDQAS